MAYAKLPGRAVYTGWSCIVGPAELVDFLVDEENATEISYSEFVLHVDIDTAPLELTQFEVLPTDWSVTWLQTRLPSGLDAWVMQHSGIEFLFLDVPFNHELEAGITSLEVNCKFPQT